MKIMIEELKELIKHHTHNITDENENKWKVLELSDVKNIIEDYLEAKLNNVDLATVVDSYSEKDMDNAYDKGFKDAMIKYSKD